MKIIAISGSASEQSSNFFLLKAIEKAAGNQYSFEIIDNLAQIPLFTPDRLKRGEPQQLKEIKEKIAEAKGLIISTPEYTHNIPAILKNFIEWCTHSGEFDNKAVLPITFTPHSPRGEHAMQSLLFSLQAMNARIIASLPLYKTDVLIKDEKIELPEDIQSVIQEALLLF